MELDIADSIFFQAGSLEALLEALLRVPDTGKRGLESPRLTFGKLRTGFPCHAPSWMGISEAGDSG